MKRIKSYGSTDHQVLIIPSLEDLDADVLSEILSRVPARSIVRSCRFVCKRWLSLILSSHFVESHRIHSQTRGPSLIIRTTNRIEQKTKYFSVTESLFEDTRALNASLLRTSTGDEHMLVSSSGFLFCLIDRMSHSVRICNPFTGEITPSIGRSIRYEGGIGTIDRVVASYGFGFDPSTKTHKVVRVWDIRKFSNGIFGVAVNVCEVLTLGKDHTWRKIAEVPPCISETPAVSLNATIYWMKSTGAFPWQPVAKYKALVAFDMGSETFREISIPKSLLEETRLIKLLEVDGCIAIFQRVNNFEVKLWIFNGNWTEEVMSMPLDWDRYGLHESIHIPGTDIIILKARRTHDPATDLISIYIYDRKKKTFEKVNILGIPSLMMRPLGRIKTMGTMDYTFFTMFESLAPVQKQQQY